MREFPLPNGPCDYLLFVAGRAAGVIEADTAGLRDCQVDAVNGLEASLAKAPGYCQILPSPLPSAP